MERETLKTMNNYEGIFIIKSDLKEEDVKGIFKSISDSIAKNDGNVKKEENWGKKPLAYSIRKFKEAYYYKVDFSMLPGAVSKLEAACKLNADILRAMVTRR